MDFDELWYALEQPWLEDEIRAVICRTIIRLPADVQRHALRRIVYVTFGSDIYGQAFSLAMLASLAREDSTLENRWLVTLNKNIENRADAEYLVAHEIAHTWETAQIAPYMYDLLEEERADKLAAEWGFRIPRRRHTLHQDARQCAGLPLLDAPVGKPRRKVRVSERQLVTL